MNCGLNCNDCPFASMERFQGRGIVVSLVGSVPDSGFLDFSKSPVLTFAHRGYEIRFVNFSGDNYHVGRKVLAAKPDVVLNFADATDLDETLLLTSRLVDMDCHVALVLSRYDELMATGHSVDTARLGGLLGFRTMTLGRYSEEDFSRLLSHVVDTFETPLSLKRHIHVPYGNDIDRAIEDISEVISRSESLVSSYHDRYLAVRLLEDPQYIIERIEHDPYGDAIKGIAARKKVELERIYGKPAAELVVEARNGFIHGALQETLRHGDDSSDHSVLQRIDSVLTSRIFGFPILLAVLFAVFQVTFTLGAWPEAWINRGVSTLAAVLHSAMSPGWLSSMLIDGVLEGVGAVLAFLPNIIILFFLLSLLEDSGYMARAAFLMDKVMHKVGLHGKSFVPMLIGFGCNVPAIMAARSIEDRKDRTLTMLMVPFMSCSARLPVYLLFVSAFFPDHRALVMISIYLLGVLLSILFAFVMKKTAFFRKDSSDYVSELPAFRNPTWRAIRTHVWEKTADYLKKISTVILAASVIIWALEYFPAYRTEGGRIKEESVLASIGHRLEPVMRPLGFDWKMNVCLLTGLPAKEAIVSTMGILYYNEDSESLSETLREESGITAPAALAFMVFVLLYFPCLATTAALKREAGWKWAVFIVIHSLLLAWVAAWAIFRIGTLLL